MGVYPFMFGSIKDFEPVAQEIIKVSNRKPLGDELTTDENTRKI